MCKIQNKRKNLNQWIKLTNESNESRTEQINQEIRMTTEGK
jgi:hypothetical protein